MLAKEVIQFFKKQNYAIVSTLDQKGNPHNACKGIVRIEDSGCIYLLDVFLQHTFANLKRNPNISITAIDEHKFQGYCLKGKANIVAIDKLDPDVLKEWEEKIAQRITHRLLKNIQGEKGHLEHPEAQLPKPQYMIALQVKEVVNLTPSFLL